MQLIEAYRKENPLLGQFSPEQYLREEGSMGQAFIPAWKKGVAFTNLKAKHVKPLLINRWVAEIHEAALNRRYPRLSVLLDHFEDIMAQRGGWAAEMYVRTGIAGLAPPPAKPSRWSRLFGRK